MRIICATLVACPPALFLVSCAEKKVSLQIQDHLQLLELDTPLRQVMQFTPSFIRGSKRVSSLSFVEVVACRAGVGPGASR